MSYNMTTTLILRHFVHSEDAKATVDDDEGGLICFANHSASESSWIHHRDPNQGHDLSHIALTSPYSGNISLRTYFKCSYIHSPRSTITIGQFTVNSSSILIITMPTPLHAGLIKTKVFF